ncbi:3'-5' exonuclease [Robertkochia aurantiaca]|uniref:3'-5' exonuclease n=1 Tax=Robertkochia aurantiaca TaxID=2873700 RepID=UPI001CCBF648|nr:3'-5' exonuclease [Robertkochia sp. 3YJGBD-33]
MLHKIILENLLFLDIETVPGHASFDDLPEEERELFSDKTAYRRKPEETAASFYHQAGIWAEFGKIICISVGYFHHKGGTLEFRTKSFYEEEKILLQQFANLLDTHFAGDQFLMCGHNIKEFDIPYIARRMLINGIALPAKLNLFGKKPWEIPHLDTMELWKFGDYKHYTSLKLLTHVLGVPSPKEDIDGSMVRSVYYDDNDLDKIIIYCERDVVAVAQVILRLKGMPLLDESDIRHV